jgi:hypothetical protein
MGAPAVKVQQPVEMTPREFTEFAVRLRGEPIDLSRRPWLSRIYDQPFVVDEKGRYRRKMLMIFGRQCEKSTTIANMGMALANLHSYLRLLYVTASDEQMREFSDDKLRAIILDSPELMRLSGQVKSIRSDSKETQNVKTRRWKNQSKLVLRSVYRSPDRVRGISSDVLQIDELQDIYTDFLPVIEEVLFASDMDGGHVSVYAGTPKTFDNPLENYWARHSTQNEWMVKCTRCNFWNCIETRHIGPTGLQCQRCDKELNPIADSCYARLGRADSEWEGFRVPQPTVLYAYRHRPDVFEMKWRDLLKKKKRYTRSKFENEVMARSFDAGTKPVTYEEVRRCALPDRNILYERDINKQLKSTHTWAGVDWGTGDESFTILSIWRYDMQGRFALIFAKRYVGVESDPDHSIRDIVQWCRAFNVNIIGADWGFGFHANPRLQKAFGAHKVVCYQHAGKQKEKVKWDKLGMKFITHRTRVLNDVFTLIKRGPVSGGIAFTNWDEFETFANDILAVYQENSRARGELVYDHPRGTPDDFLHTICYALLASQMEPGYRRPDLHAPSPGQTFKP